jgi:hypothetical protein
MLAYKFGYLYVSGPEVDAIGFALTPQLEQEHAGYAAKRRDRDGMYDNLL